MLDLASIDVATATTEQLIAIAESLGMPVEALSTPDFPDFRPDMGYKLKVFAAKNIESHLGANQAELSVYAIDEDDEPVRKARGKLWLTYPSDTAGFKFKDQDTRERAIRDMLTLLRCGHDGARYEAYRVVQEGQQKKHYFDANDNELIGPAIKAASTAARILGLQEIHRRMVGDAEAWTNVTFYAQYRISESQKTGKTYKGWQRLSKTPIDGLVYVFDPSQMMLRPGAEAQINVEELF